MGTKAAFMTQFRKETIMGFEKEDSLIASLCTQEMVVSGNVATFLVADSGGAKAVTRGVNGDIPSRTDNLNQFEVTLTEEHDLVERTGFNLFASQGEGRKIMQMTGRSVINRRKDDIVYGALSTATNNWGAAAVATLPLILKAKARLNMASVLNKRDRLSSVITPAFHAKLMELEQFSSHDYIKSEKFEGVGKDRAFAWLGVDWIVDEEAPGAGTAAAQCFMWHKAAVGCGANTAGMQVLADYEAKQDRSWCRNSIYMGAKQLQNSGILVMPHNDAIVLA